MTENMSGSSYRASMPAMRELPVVPICRTLARLSDSPETLHGSRVPPREEGRIAIVTNVGCGMRWTRLARETSAPVADGEAAWS
jgi:hypothetical protein